MSTIRLLIDAPATGPRNMAVDEVLLESAGRDGIATLRFYHWQPPCLSLGYFQSYDDRRGHAASSSCQVVRRASGGGAIVHDMEITYSLALPAAEVPHPSSNHLYQIAHRALQNALSEWHIATAICDRPAGAQSAFLCFQRHAVGDLLFHKQHKIAGSAQRRQRQAILQHGSVLLQTSPSAPELPGLAELSGELLPAPALARCWLERLQREFRWEAVEPSSLTAEEDVRVAQWMATRFDNPAWLRKR